MAPSQVIENFNFVFFVNKEVSIVTRMTFGNRILTGYTPLFSLLGFYDKLSSSNLQCLVVGLRSIGKIILL